MDFSDFQPSIHWAQLYATHKSVVYPIRRIYDFELLYIKEGHVAAHLDHHTYELHAGQLLFIQAGVPHRWEILSDPVAVFMGIHFDFYDELDIIQDIDVIVKDHCYTPERVCREPIIEGFPRLSENPVQYVSGETVRRMGELIDEFHHRAPGFTTVCSGLMQHILVELYRQLRAEPKVLSQTHLHHDRLAKLMQWIGQHYREDCSTSALAKRVGFTEDYMAKLFRIMTGLPPNKYIQKLRHAEARRLLRATDLSVEEIGKQVGYDDIHYFSRVFRKWEGISPRDYRNALPMY